MHSHHSVLSTYVETLVENDYTSGKFHKCFGSENTTSSPVPEIDLVLDGGAFNGGYSLGALLYIKCAEKKGYIRVARISGCSVGACIGLAFVLDKLYQMGGVLSNFMDLFRKKNNMSFYKEFVTEFIDILLEENDLAKCQNSLYISCFNKNENKQIVVNTYKQKENLLQAILRTIYIPFISSNHITDAEGYIDGAYPHIFMGEEEVKDRKQLYIQLNGIDKFFNMIHIKSETSMLNRIIRGVEDMRMFVLRSGDTTFMCSFVERWNEVDKVMYNSKPLICTYVLTALQEMQRAYDLYFPENLKEKVSIISHMEASKNVYNLMVRLITGILESSIRKIV